MARLDFKWAGIGPDGARFLEGHPFARDLDLFGPASLFQLLDTARQKSAKRRLRRGWPAARPPVRSCLAKPRSASSNRRSIFVKIWPCWRRELPWAKRAP